MKVLWPVFLLALAGLQLGPGAFVPREFAAVVPGTVAQDIDVTPKAGWVYIVGTTTSPDYPTTPDAFDRTCGTDGDCNPFVGRFGGIERQADVVLTFIDSAGQIRYSTFLGGAGRDDSPVISVGRDGTVWLAGATRSPTFDGHAGDCAGTFWVARFDPTMRRLQELRCYPWELPPAAAAIDGQGRFWVVGSTTTPGAATAGAYQPQLAGSNDAFVARFAEGQAAPQYATYIGGRASDRGSALAVSPGGAVVVTGRTNSQEFPVVRAVKGALLETSLTLGDAFVAVLDPTGRFLQFSTYWGGSRDDAGSGVAMDAAGNIYVTGQTRSAEMPSTTGAYQARCDPAGTCFDAFVTKFSADGTLLASTFLGGTALDLGREVHVMADGRVVVLGTTQSPDFEVLEPSPIPRLPGVNAEHTFLTVFDSGLSRLLRSGYVGDRETIPNVGTLAVRDEFAFVAGQARDLTGGSTGARTYLRAYRIP